ncbi:MAG TPA: tetratricopeptide repeat protein [Polyangia bacterium]|nr:tetratricopeptide repeat protein [Polyangia bacterium]
MTTTVSTALAALQLRPDDSQALQVLKGVHPGNGAGLDAEALAKALSDARRWHRERADFELCLELIDLELAFTTLPARRADLFHEKGRLLFDDLLRDEAGQAAVRQALGEVSDHRAANESLAQMTLVRANWEPIARRYLQQADEAKDPTLAASLHGSVAELYLKYRPGQPEGETHLRKSMELNPANRRAAAHLERILRESGRREELLGLYEQRAERAQTREERTAAEVAAGDLSQEMDRADQASAHYQKALEIDPNEPRALRAVRASLVASQSWGELAKLLEAASRTRRGERDVPLLVDLATLFWKRMNQPDLAEPFFRKVRKLDPSNHAMVDFFRAHYEARNEQAQFLSVLAQAQKTEPDVERRVAMGIEMARAAEQRPQHAEKAIEIWKGVLRLRPHLPEAVPALRRLYTATEKWNALLELLKDELEAVPASDVDEKINRHLEIVAIYRDRLNLDVMVVTTYLNILALRPDHPAALAALASRYEAQGRWGDLVQILARQAESAPDPAARVALHRRIASIWADKLGKHQNAVASFEKILEAEPGDTETAARLKELYVKNRSWRPLIEVLRRELPHVDAAGRRSRLVEMARLAGERLNDAREAITLYNQVLAIAPQDPEALAGLATLYERERRWPALVEILDRQRGNAEGNAAAELPLLERRGTLLYERMGAAEAAIQVFRRIQSLDAKNARAARALREIYAQAGDYASLESLYADQGAFGELCDQLTSLADRTADMGARTRLLERVATLAQEKLNQPDRALKAYERILTTDPRNRKAALALIPLYRSAQKWPRLLATYEALLGPSAAGDGASQAERLDLYAEARKICEERLGSKALAFQWCARAFQVAPKNAEVRADLERLAGEADEWGALAAAYEARFGASTDAEERLWLLRRVLRISATRLFRPQDTRRAAEAILAELGYDEEADVALEQVLVSAKAWPELAKLLHTRADRAPDAAERVKLLLRIAQLEEERVGDMAAAAATWTAIVDADPTNERARRALVRVSEARQDWIGVVEALRRELATRGASMELKEREEVLLRVAHLQETRLEDHEGAFSSYREVLQANPHAAPAVAGLERLAGHTQAERAELARLTLPFYERTENAAKLAVANAALLEVADTVGERVERLEKLRALHGGPLKDPAAAYRAAQALFDIDPADGENREALLGFAAEAALTSELADKLRATAQTAQDRNLRRDLLVTVAELEEKQLGRSGEAEKVYAQILADEPLHAGAFKALTRLYRDGQRWNQLRALLDARQLASLSGPERLDLLAEIAELDETALADADHALGAYEKMLELDAAEPRAHRGLERLYAARERWSDLEGLLGGRVATASASEAQELEFRRAELRASRLNDVDGALRLLEGIVKAAPQHEGARRLLEKLVTVPAHRQRVAKILEPVYEGGGAWARLVAVLEVQREAVEGAAAIPLLARIAELQETRLQARAMALATWRQVLAADPANPDALTEVERLGTALERYAELVDVYQDLAFRRGGADVAGRAELLSRAARLYAGKLNNRRAAIDAWKLVQNLDVNNREIAGPAAAALEALYNETGDVANLVKTLQLQARWVDRAADKKPILFRIAALQEKSLGDNDAAVATLRSILELDPQDRAAIDALDRIFEAGAQHRQRVEILRRRIDLAGDAGARQELWRRITDLLERDVGDIEEAIAASVSILDENPEDDRALETLARLYEQQGRHRDRLEIIERRLALLPADDARRLPLLRQIAALLEGPLGDAAGALERWREVLARAPSDAEAIAAIERFLAPGGDAGLRLAAAQLLEPIYARAQRFPELAGIIRIYVDEQNDPRARLSELMRLAALEETRLADPEAARGTIALAIRDALSEPELPGLLDTYERLTGPERMPEATTLYREISPDVLDESVKLRLDRTIASTAATQGDAAVAADYYRRILDRVPEDDGALAALERIYRGSGDDAALYEILVRRAELARDTAGERALRVQIGEVAETKLQRLDDGIAAYERVLEIAPGDRAAAQALDRLYTRAERWTDLTRLLEDQLQKSGRPERELVDLRFRLARIEQDQRGDREAALEHLKVVLDGDPDHPDAISMLEGMLDDIAVQGMAATLLEPVYAGRGDWPSLIKIGEIRLLQVEEPAERLAWTKRIARLFEEQLEDFDSALRWYGKVFQEAPTERLSAEPLLRLAGKLDRWQDAASLLASYLEGELSEEPAVLENVRRTAEIFDLRLGQHAEAQKYYRRLYDARPDDAPTTQLYEAALERWGAWQDLRELVDERAGRAPDPAARVALLRRSAKLDEEKLEDIGRAIGTLREALDVDPDDRRTAVEMERLLGQQARWPDLADHLSSMLERLPEGAERDAVTLRLADILATQLGDASTAVDRYADIVARDGASARDLSTAVTALEGMANDPDQRYRVAIILEPVYRRANDLGKLVGALDAQLEAADDRAERVRLLGEMAELHQQMGRVDLAFDARSRAFLTDVESPDTLGAMDALGRAARLHAPLAAALQKGAVEAVDPDLQSRLWTASARLLEAPLNRPEDAIEAWRAALAAKSDDREAFVALERLLTAAGRAADLVDVLERHLEVSIDGEERKAIAKRIALLQQDALDQPDQAVRAWETALGIDPNDGEALEALAQLHLSSGAFRELADIYGRKIELTDRADERRMLFMQSARIFEEKLSEPDRAIEQLRALLAETQGDGEALADLDRILTGEGRHVDLVEVLDQRVGRAQDAASRDELAFRAARLTEVEIGDVEGAIGRYARILQTAPKHAGARDALFAIARGDDYRLPAVDVLEPVARAGKEWDAVVELLELRLAIEDGAAGRMALLAEIARIDEIERRDVKAAFSVWARALTEDATVDEPRAALERLAAGSRDWRALADVYAERMEATFDAGLQRTLAMRLASLHENELGDAAKAADYLRQAQSLPGEEEPVLAALERVLAKLGENDELAQVLAREAELASEPAAQADYLAALGALRLASLDDPDGALAAFRDAVERVPEHQRARAALVSLLDRDATREGALDVLEPLAEARGDHQELIALYEQRIDLRDDRGERAHWLRKIAEVSAERLNDPARAVAALGRALREDPSPGGALDDLERIASAGDLSASGAQEIEGALAGAEPDSARELALRAARLYEEAGDAPSAERLYRRVLDQDAENTDALQALEGLYRAAKRSAQLADVLQRRAAVDLDPQLRRTRLLEAARLHEGLGDVAASVAALQALRAADEDDLDALKELARLHEKLGQPRELDAVLAQQARLTEDPGQRARLWGRVGELRLGVLGDADAAAEAYREALEGVPDDAVALSALESIEEKREDWSTLQEVLLRRLGSATGADQVAVLLKLARNAEQRLQDTDQAVGFLRQLLDADARNGFGYLELERILRGAERWYDLVDVLAKHAEMEGAAGRKPTELALRVAIANVWEKELDSPESAADALEKVLEVDPNNAGALLSLARVHERSERWDDAADALERAAAHAASPPELAEIHFRTAGIQRTKGADPAEVERALLRALDADATHGPTLEALEAIAREAKDDERLVSILDLKLQIAASDAERAKLLREVAALLSGPLAQPAAALPYLQRLIAVDPTEVAGREQLADALMGAGRIDEALRLIGEIITELGKARRGKEAARWHTRLGTIAEARGDTEAASAAFNAAYKLDPSHPATIAALGRLAYRRSDLDSARKFYRSLLLQNFDEATAGVSKAEVYLMLGRMHVLANEIPKARNMFERGLEVDPKNVDLKAALTGLG